MAWIKCIIDGEEDLVKAEHIVRWHPQGGQDQNTKIWTVDGKTAVLQGFMINEFLDQYQALIAAGGEQVLDLTPFQT